jgi:hypothetical protein
MSEQDVDFGPRTKDSQMSNEVIKPENGMVLFRISTGVLREEALPIEDEEETKTILLFEPCRK